MSPIVLPGKFIPFYPNRFQPGNVLRDNNGSMFMVLAEPEYRSSFNVQSNLVYVFFFALNSKGQAVYVWENVKNVRCLDRT